MTSELEDTAMETTEHDTQREKKHFRKASGNWNIEGWGKIIAEKLPNLIQTINLQVHEIH